MERYETADGAVYVIKKAMRCTPTGIVDHEVQRIKPDQDGRMTGYVEQVGTYGDCCRYVEDKREKARAIA